MKWKCGCDPIEIILDTREKAEDRARIIKQFPKSKYPNLNFKEEALKEGDFLIKCDNGNGISVLVERKSIPDLYGSIMGSKGKKARFPDQCCRLMTHENDSVVVLLVTGSVNDYCEMMKKRGKDIEPELFDSFIASVLVRYNIRVIIDNNNLNGIKRAIKVGIKCCEGNLDLVQHRNLDALLARFLNITLVQWKSIKEAYGTDLTFIAKADLACVKGIGKVKEKRIKDLIVGRSDDWLK